MMEIDYITGRSPENIPPIGSKIPVCLKGYDLLFQVDEYGDGEEVELSPVLKKIHNLRTNKAYKIILKGHIIIPAGSPIEAFRDLLGADIEDVG